MEYTIRNPHLSLIASTKGGLLHALRTTGGKELLWDGKEEIWPARAPVCFPWCGMIQDQWYELDGVRHEATTRHGFVRDMEHELVAQSGTAMTFKLVWKGDEVWPWAFTFRTTHKVEGKKAYTICTAINDSQKPMPVQMGFHPGFVCPFVEGSDIEEYAVRFESGKVVPLERHIFDVDSLAFENVGNWARLEHVPSGRYIQVNTGGLTTLIWSKPGIPGFVCVEPWDGYIGESHNLLERPGAISLAPGESKTWTLEMDFGKLEG